jgi:hypothetical protein
MSPETRQYLTAAVLCFLLVAGIAAAQSKNGTVTGSVLDPTGKMIPGVTVILTKLETSAVRTSITNDSGEYKLDAPPGAYELSANLSGFETATISGIRLGEGESQQYNFTMKPKLGAVPRGSPGHVILIGK